MGFCKTSLIVAYVFTCDCKTQLTLPGKTFLACCRDARVAGWSRDTLHGWRCPACTAYIDSLQPFPVHAVEEDYEISH